MLRRAEQQVRALLQSAHTPAPVDGWLAEGAALGDEAFARLVVEQG